MYVPTYLHCKVTDKVILVHAMKACSVKRRVTPLILILGDGWR